MRKILLVFCLIAACGEPAPAPEAAAAAPGIPATLEVPGRLENKDIAEASGLAASQRAGDVLWTHNDSGAKARLYALDPVGEALGRAKLEDAENVDWEDMASFTLDGTPYLLVADVGDNDGERDTVTLYVIEEPDLAEDSKPDVATSWSIELRYPGGPRDVESVAVDIENERVFLLTKRTIPAELYAVPLRPRTDDVQLATLLTTVTSLPQPTRQDVRLAPKLNDWHWQATGMDIAPDGSALVILTYHPAIYLYQRDGDWPNSLRASPLRFTLRNMVKPEAVAFSADSQSIFVTNENKNAALLRVDFE